MGHCVPSRKSKEDDVNGQGKSKKIAELYSPLDNGVSENAIDDRHPCAKCSTCLAKRPDFKWRGAVCSF